VNFTPGQQNAFDVFNDYISDPSPAKCFVLKGYAGTGKTTLISHLVNHYQAKNYTFKLLAPTGRAAKVMASYSGFPASTIHKQIYFLSDVVEQKGFVKAPNPFRHTLFIVDEASMIGADASFQENNLLSDLYEFVLQGEGCSLVLVGDPGQLPPVGQQHSPAMDLQYLEGLFPKPVIYSAALTEVVRQTSLSEIIEMATHIRNLRGEEKAYYLIKERDVHRITGDLLLERLESACASGVDSFALLTMSNSRAGKWNQSIRKQLLFFDEIVERDEQLMVVRNNYFWASNESSGLIANGELLTVKKVIKEELCYGIEFLHLLVVLHSDSDKELQVIAFKKLLESDEPQMSREDRNTLFWAVELDYAHEKNKRKRIQAVLKNPYLNALQIKYSYAVTAHKAQGGQWDTVFIDYGFIPEGMNQSAYRRWLYTCITRAKRKLYLINFPETFFLKA
jgi:exodeoxyribonuclease-5